VSLPRNFCWGAATAAYQVEGAADEDGRGESIWDRFCATPARVRNGESGAVACDFYHRYRDDIGLMQELGLDAFRFSVAWPRVLPEGRGRLNSAGLDFYDRLVDDLLAAGIEPVPTLYHWDLPQPLEDAGGWPERATAEAFVELVAAVADRLGDRVERWITHNEPWVAAWLGYGWGIHAPGRASADDAIAAAHHLLLSHGWAAQALRERCPGAEVGITLNLAPTYAAGGSLEDREAVRTADGYLNRWFLDPLFRGAYPEDMLRRFSPPVADGDLAAIAAPLDFLGVNYYFRALVEHDPGGGLPRLVRPQTGELTATGWEVFPEALTRLLVRIANDYAPPAIYITENGAAYEDVRAHDGAVRDPERRAYQVAHLAATARAVDAGVPVRGYYVWSLLDNFEWAHGYSKRFGIVFVDYPTLERVPKSSFAWYRDTIVRQRADGAAWRASA
jgi:beta-glucosidase